MSSLPADFAPGAVERGFVNAMRMALQARQAIHYDYNLKRGQIVNSRMYRLGMPLIDSGDWNSRVFRKKVQVTDTLDTAVTILCDFSGSMWGSKIETAGKACCLVNHAFANVLHIPLKLVGFTACREIPTLTILKDWNDRVSTGELCESLSTASRNMRGNNDADALLWTYTDIMRRNEKRKVIIVMSDGTPTDGRGDPIYALKTVTSRIEAERQVDLYGLGIMDTNVQVFYKRHEVVMNISGLQHALITLVRDAVTST